MWVCLGFRKFRSLGVLGFGVSVPNWLVLYSRHALFQANSPLECSPDPLVPHGTPLFPTRSTCIRDWHRKGTDKVCMRCFIRRAPKAHAASANSWFVSLDAQWHRGFCPESSKDAERGLEGLCARRESPNKGAREAHDGAAAPSSLTRSNQAGNATAQARRGIDLFARWYIGRLRHAWDTSSSSVGLRTLTTELQKSGGGRPAAHRGAESDRLLRLPCLWRSMCPARFG